MHLDRQAYATAERLLRHNRGELVLGGKITPRWLDGGARFWYAVDTPAGKRFVVADPTAGTRESHESQPVEGVQAAGNPLEIPAPDGKHAIYLTEHNLHARFLDGSRDWALTGDGSADLSYGANPDYLMYSKIGRDDWELVAVAYVIDQTLSPDPPTDLRGAGYHEHVWTCLVDGEELDEDEFGPISREECRAREGEWSPGGVWMTHVWLIDNPSGPFAETNPALV